MMNFWGAKKGANGGESRSTSLPKVPLADLVFSAPVVELFTPPLGDIILPGVTRDSVLALARAHADPSHPFRLAGLPDELVVSERKVTMPELRDAARDGSLLEVFGTGTAAVVTSVERIGYCDEDVVVPVEGGSTGGFGRIAEAFYDVLQAIQYGDVEHEGWSVLV